MSDTMELNRVFGLAEEANWGVAQTAPDWYQEVKSQKIKQDGDPLTLDSGMSRAPTTVRPGPYVPKPSNTHVIDLKRIGHYLKGLLGGYKFTAGADKAPNVHEFWGSNNKLLPSFTGWGTFDQFTKVITGILMDSMKIEIKDDYITADTDMAAKKDTMIASVPSLTDINAKMLPGATPLVYYEASLLLDNAIPAGIVSSATVQIKNNIKTDDAIGIGSRFMQAKAQANKRDSTFEIESSMEPATLDLIKAAEYGSKTALEPQMTLYEMPAKLTFDPYDDSQDQMEMTFPSCTIEGEYEAKGADSMNLKCTLKACAKKEVTLNDGTTKILTDIYVKLLNNQPEIKAAV